jgi:hypothetical protein
MYIMALHYNITYQVVKGQGTKTVAKKSAKKEQQNQ